VNRAFGKALDETLMNTILRVIVIALLLLTAGAASAQKVAVGYDKTADFSKFKTYSWTKGVPAKDPAIDRQIVSTIERQLEAKGLRKQGDGADLLISYHAAVVNTFDEATVARPGTWGPRTGSMEQVWQVVRGSLIVEMADGSTKSEVWRATATDTLSNEPITDTSKYINKVTKRINKVVEKMFNHYPPTKAK
jgi:hypothetical protein